MKCLRGSAKQAFWSQNRPRFVPGLVVSRKQLLLTPHSAREKPGSPAAVLAAGHTITYTNLPSNLAPRYWATKDAGPDVPLSERSSLGLRL